MHSGSEYGALDERSSRVEMSRRPRNSRFTRRCPLSITSGLMQTAGTRLRAKLLLVVAIMPVVAFGQIPGAIGVPTMGFLLDDNARTFRPILGFPGSSTLGDAMDFGRPVVSGFSLPDNRHALAVFEEENSLTYLDFVARPMEIRAIPGVATTFTSYSISPNGKSVGLVDSTHQRLQVVTGFPSNPSLALEYAAETLPPGRLLRVAVNDAATAMLVIVSSNDVETIYRWHRGSGFELLTPSVAVEGFTFINATDAVYADKMRNEVFLVHDVQEKPWMQFVAGPEDGIVTPTAVASSGNEFHIASVAAGTVVSFDLDGRRLRSQPCNCKLSRLSPIAQGTFVMTDRLNETIFVLSGTGEQSRIVFVPPAK